MILLHQCNSQSQNLFQVKKMLVITLQDPEGHFFQCMMSIFHPTTLGGQECAFFLVAPSKDKYVQDLLLPFQQQAPTFCFPSLFNNNCLAGTEPFLFYFCCFLFCFIVVALIVCLTYCFYICILVALGIQFIQLP